MSSLSSTPSQHNLNVKSGIKRFSRSKKSLGANFRQNESDLFSAKKFFSKKKTKQILLSSQTEKTICLFLVCIECASGEG